MTPQEALAYAQRHSIYRMRDGSPWPYAEAVLSDPEHPRHSAMVAVVQGRRDAAQRAYREAQRDLAHMSERYPADSIVITVLQGRVDAAREALA